MILMLCTTHIVKNHHVVLGNMLNLLSEELHCFVLESNSYKIVWHFEKPKERRMTPCIYR